MKKKISLMDLPHPSPDASFAALKSDGKDIIRHFRSMHLFDIAASGSAQFGAKALKLISKKIKKHTRKNIFVIDLRQESHGFVRIEKSKDIHPVCWYAENDWGNAGMSQEKAEVIEHIRLDILSRSYIVNILPELPKKSKRNKKPLLAKPVRIKGTITEQELISENGFGYKRFFVTDHLRPDNRTVDDFMQLLIQNKTNVPWYHFHCHGGDGRTTSFMVMYDMLLHAQHLSAEEIIDRNVKLSKYPSLIKFDPNSKNVKKKYAIERLQFLKLFYKYAKTNPLNAGMSWNNWLKK